MLFGRTNNMVRRRNRPHGSYYRDKRRGALDQATLLEISRGVTPHKSLVARIISAVTRPLRKR